MNKYQIFKKYIYDPYNDGTSEDLYKVYKKHPQTDPLILKSALKQMSKYIAFCMDISVRYRCKDTGKNRQYGKNLDSELWVIWLWNYGITIYPPTDLKTIKYEYIEDLIKVRQMGERYEGLLVRMLDGEVLINLKEDEE